MNEEAERHDNRGTDDDVHYYVGERRESGGHNRGGDEGRMLKLLEVRHRFWVGSGRPSMLMLVRSASALATIRPVFSRGKRETLVFTQNTAMRHRLGENDNKAVCEMGASCLLRRGASCPTLLMFITDFNRR